LGITASPNQGYEYLAAVVQGDGQATEAESAPVQQPSVPRLSPAVITSINASSSMALVPRALSIEDADDLNMAKASMGERMKGTPAVVESVVVSRNPTKPADTEES
jgi:hypothetical protein